EPEAMLLMGRTQLMLKDRTSAHSTFRELIARYPKSGSAAQAERFLAETGGYGVERVHRHVGRVRVRARAGARVRGRWGVGGGPEHLGEAARADSAGLRSGAGASRRGSF